MNPSAAAATMSGSSMATKNGYLDGHEEWIPRQHLVDDDQAEPCDWVDWWYDDDEQQPKPYICYMKGLPEYYDYMTASEGGDCVVQAINALYKITAPPTTHSSTNRIGRISVPPTTSTPTLDHHDQGTSLLDAGQW
ncbi:hypothetical protein PHYPSEUDO_003226 [Phytophthora pseudosyringae]|uniref:Uncharacterized protein n=1 Tax=Phytophthora pseudosyringae TaxID=221518 RepID=A0A8T1V231_9STRA|nr:hypothetical protein PHYPSEUDO_003226 [Phytophthora pseudosyringae]